MDNQLLQSVIEITRQRDMDSLECSLVISLAELLPVKSISIFKCYKEHNGHVIEKTAQLNIESSTDNQTIFKWAGDLCLNQTDSHLTKCLKTKLPDQYATEEGETRFLFPIGIDNECVGAVAIDSDKDIHSHMATINTLMRIYENYLYILNESERDKLTGLFNRRTFDKKLDRLLKAQLRQKQQYLLKDTEVERRHMEDDSYAWLALIDFDNFKSINDTYGHVYGDEVLLIFSQKMKELFRESDLLFRFGGDEFVIILEPVPMEMAEKTFENFRKKIEAHSFPLVGHITISIGFAKITDKDYPPEILDRADKALYQAKLSGRNGTKNYEELHNEGVLNEPKKTGAIDLF